MSASQFAIVTFNPSYRADFARLNYAWIEALFAVEELDRRMLDHPEEEVIAPGGEIFFAVKAGKVIGTVALKVEDATTFELTKMAVDDAERGHGYGQALLNAAIDHARRKGARRLVLSSHTKLTPAIAMYRKAGFIERNDTSSCYSRCNIHMQLTLYLAQDSAPTESRKSGSMRAKRIAAVA
jgi:putative acetyltransferase